MNCFNGYGEELIPLRWSQYLCYSYIAGSSDPQLQVVSQIIRTYIYIYLSNTTEEKEEIFLYMFDPGTERK
jgi:hypothetical protein